jgi:hypothetical protein
MQISWRALSWAAIICNLEQYQDELILSPHKKGTAPAKSPYSDLAFASST